MWKVGALRHHLRFARHSNLFASEGRSRSPIVHSTDGVQGVLPPIRDVAGLQFLRTSLHNRPQVSNTSMMVAMTHSSMEVLRLLTEKPGVRGWCLEQFRSRVLSSQSEAGTCRQT